jgi:hypothetical protein
MTCKGTWVNGVPQGKMMLQCEGGEYVGTLDKDLLFHGKGKLKVIQQKSFIVRGHWIHGVLSKDPVRMTTLTVNESGEHVFTHYRGQLNPDYQEHGQGERTNKKDGSKIRGQWKNGSFIGHNTYSI